MYNLLSGMLKAFRISAQEKFKGPLIRHSSVPDAGSLLDGVQARKRSIRSFIMNRASTPQILLTSFTEKQTRCVWKSMDQYILVPHISKVDKSLIDR